ncbi:MAG: UDP-glucuronic acid decarboxylase family protein [Anaerolineae bacterium]
MRILLTGGAGFIGSHLADLLLKEGHDVIALDNLITGSLHNIAHLENAARFRFIRGDVIDPIQIEGKLDAIFHLASLPSPVDYLEMPIKTMKVGSIGTLNALGLAKAKQARFLLASTSEVYGDPQVHPQPESYWGNVNPVGPRGVYDESKRFAEALTMAYHREHGVQTRIARIFNTYGPRMRLNDGRVVPNFVRQALNHEPLTVYDDGSRTRSFCYVSDLVTGLYQLLLSDEVQPVNLGNPTEMTILQFAEAVREAAGSTSEIVFITPEDDRTQDDPHTRQPDITRAKTLLGWEPQIELTEGLRQTVTWFRQQLNQ